MGLLLLRIAVGVTTIIDRGGYLSNHAHPTILDWVVGLAAVATASFVLIGLFTPVMSTLIGIEIVGSSLTRIPAFTANLVDLKLTEILALTIAAAIVFLGPGAFSLDARLFGRREIIIPSSSRSPNF